MGPVSAYQRILDEVRDRRLQVAPVVRVTPTKTTRLIVVTCPFCGRPHTHGWPYGGGDPGHRVAHCVGAGLAGSYLIEAPA